MTTHNVSFKPGASTPEALTIPLATYLNGYGMQGDRGILPDVPFEYLERLGETLVESGATKIEITGIHYVQSYPIKYYPEDFIRRTLTNLHEITGVDFTPLLLEGEEHVDILDVRSEANAREAVSTLLGLGFEAKYHLTHALHWGADQQRVTFQLHPDFKTQAIKVVRMWTGEGLKWCKDTVESGSIYISGGPLRVQDFKDAFEPYVRWSEPTASPLPTFALPLSILDRDALANHLEALARLIRTMSLPA